MSSCTYKFKNASGEEVTITGQAEMKAFLANGGLEQLLPGKVLPWQAKPIAGKYQVIPLRKRLEDASGQDLKSVFDVMSLAGERMTHSERVDALMAEDHQEVSAALDSVAPPRRVAEG